MDILFLSEPSYPLHPGGAGKCTHLLAAGLAARGHTVRLVCASDRWLRRENIDGVEVHRVSLPERDEAAATAVLHRYIDENLPVNSIDLVHDSGAFLSYFFHVALALKRSRGTPVVTHFRYLVLKHQMDGYPAGDWDGLPPDAFALDALRDETTQCLAVRMADLVVSPSARDASFIDALYRPEPGRLKVIPDPVAIPENPGGLRSALRTRWARPDEQLVLFGGRIDDETKGGDIVVNAFKRVLSEKPNIRLLLTAKNGHDLKAFHEALGRRITSIGWIEDIAELARVLAVADLVWMPSRHESFGMMCAEAMAAGVPVIASPVGGLGDMISHGSTGMLLGRSSPREWEVELVRHTLDLLSDPERSRGMGRAARRFVEENFSVETVCERLDGLYRELVERTRPSRDLRPESAPAIAFPRVDEADRQRYQSALGRALGAEAAIAGEHAWAGWRSSFESRCGACTRQRVAHDIRALISRRRPLRRTIAKLMGRSSAGDAVEAACPLALLQIGMADSGSWTKGDPQRDDDDNAHS